jgi:amino acid transporter
MLGIEIVAVTAYETRYRRDLGWPSRNIAYAVTILYILCTIGETLTVKWTDSHLPNILGGTGTVAHPDPPTDRPPRSTNLVINAAWYAGYPALAGFLNGCLVFSVLSAANTSLYVASRTLYGLARDVPDTNTIGKLMRKMAKVWLKTAVPAPALAFSAVSFFWLPFLQLSGKKSISDVRISQLYSTATLTIVEADRNHQYICKRRMSHCLGSSLPRLHSLLLVAKDKSTRAPGTPSGILSRYQRIHSMDISQLVSAITCNRWFGRLPLCLCFH